MHIRRVLKMDSLKHSVAHKTTGLKGDEKKRSDSLSAHKNVSQGNFYQIFKLIYLFYSQ